MSSLPPTIEHGNDLPPTPAHHGNDTPPRSAHHSEETPPRSAHHGNDTPPRPAQGISRHYVFDEDSPTTHLTPSSETRNHVTTVCQKTSENLHLLVNETSLACYRIQEHIGKTVPHLKSLNKQINEVNEEILGAGYDLEYTTEFLNVINVMPELQNIQAWLKNSLVNAGKIKDLHDNSQT